MVQSDSTSLENFKGFPFLSSLPSGVSRFSLSFFLSSLLRGWLADRTNRASTAIPSWMVKPFWENWRRTSLLILIMAFLDNLLLNRQKVEWSGEGWSKGSPKNFLKE